MRELKLKCLEKYKKRLGRTFTGAWIETFVIFSLKILEPVAPSRVRELKLNLVDIDKLTSGRTFTGAWIETLFVKKDFL